MRSLPLLRHALVGSRSPLLICIHEVDGSVLTVGETEPYRCSPMRDWTELKRLYVTI